MVKATRPARLLDPSEFGRLNGLAAADFPGWTAPSPGSASIAVVENEDGEIVSFVALQLVLHLEPFWTAPAYRNRKLDEECLRLIESQLAGTGATVYISTPRRGQRRRLSRFGFLAPGWELVEKRYD